MTDLDAYSQRTIMGTVPTSAPYVTDAVQRLPDWQRTYFEEQMLDVIRTKSILVPYANVVTDFTAQRTGKITYTELYDMEPNWNSVTEDEIWFKGGSLDSRTLSVDLAMYHNIVKFSSYQPLTMYLNNGNLRGIVTDKLGIDVTNTMDILARNAFMTHPLPKYMGDATSRATLVKGDVFDVDVAEEVRTELEENDIPGIVSTEDGGAKTILCLTTPRVIHDIRTAAGSDWLEVQEYMQTGKKFTSEVGMWGGVRFVKTNRLRLRNAGATIAQTQLAAVIVPGQGAYSLVDGVYTPGQSTSTRYVEVDSVSDFAVGDYVTIHALALGTTVLDTDGTQEIRRIVHVDAVNDRLSFDKPFLKDHTENAYVTKALNLHASLFIGGPGIVLGIAERPTIITPPMIDDAQLINRIGWRAYMKFQLFRPEMFQLVYSSGSDND